MRCTGSTGVRPSGDNAAKSSTSYGTPLRLTEVSDRQTGRAIQDGGLLSFRSSGMTSRATVSIKSAEKREVRDGS